jgi:hypothetical protein
MPGGKIHKGGGGVSNCYHGGVPGHIPRLASLLDDQYRRSDFEGMGKEVVRVMVVAN